MCSFFLFFFDRVSTYDVCFYNFALYHQIKTPIDFWYKRELNPRSLIHSLEILLIELTGTHYKLCVLNVNSHINITT